MYGFTMVYYNIKYFEKYTQHMIVNIEGYNTILWAVFNRL